MFATVSVSTRVMIICCCQLDGTLNHPEDNPLGMSVRVFTEMLNSERKMHPHVGDTIHWAGSLPKQRGEQLHSRLCFLTTEPT